MRKYVLSCLLLSLSLLASPLWAAITCGSGQATDAATPADPQVISYTVPAGSNLILFVGAGQRQGTAAQTITGVTYAGVAMTSTRAVVFDDPSAAELFYLVAPAVGTADISVNWATAPLDAQYIAFTCAGVNQATPVHDANSASSSSAGPTVTVANLVAGDVIVDFYMSDDETGEGTEGANQTLLEKQAASSSSSGASYQLAADGGVMSWDLVAASDDWAQQAVALTAASERRPIQPIMLGN